MSKLFARPNARTLAILVPLSVAALAMPTMALAAVGDDGVTYTGCLSPANNSTIRHILVGDTPVIPCPLGTTQVSFNEKGVQGDQGIQGETGATGAQGETGETGETGAQGETGAKGDQGVPGEDGVDGEVGLIGPAGPIGPSGGVKGDDGNQGNPGDDGADGADGAVGPAGPAGPAGADGPTGATGAAGPAGTAGTNGTNGVNGYDVNSATFTVGPGRSVAFEVNCDAGKLPMGGGGRAGGDITIQSTSQNSAGNGWRVRARNTDTTSHTVVASVICADAAVTPPAA